MSQITNHLHLHLHSFSQVHKSQPKFVLFHKILHKSQPIFKDQDHISHLTCQQRNRTTQAIVGLSKDSKPIVVVSSYHG